MKVGCWRQGLTKGELKAISAREWGNLWPMFATNTAVGPNSEYTEIKIYEAPSETIREKLTSDCITWLKGQRIAGVKRKKTSLYHDARRAFGDSLTDAIFDVAYLASFERRRGRPKKSVVNSRSKIADFCHLVLSLLRRHGCR